MSLGHLTAHTRATLVCTHARLLGLVLVTTFPAAYNLVVSRMNLISRCYRSTFTTQPTLGFAFDFWLLCQSSYLLFVRVVNAITFEHIASNSFCLLAGLNRASKPLPVHSQC